MPKPFKLPDGVGIEANKKTVRFRLLNGDKVHDGVGTLSIWESPTTPGSHLVTIQVAENLGPPERPAYRFTTIEITPHHGLHLRKAPAGMPHEYEISTTGEQLPPWE